MALSTFVKVGNITNLSDARYCAGMGVDEIGFCTDPDSETYLSPTEASSIQGWVSGVVFVAEGLPANEDDYTFDKVQIGIGDVKRDIASPKILELDFRNLEQASEFADSFDYLLIVSDTKTELSEADRAKLTEVAGTIPLVLGFGFTAENVREILNKIPLKGIAMTGSDEIRPGYKDYDELADILELLELDD